jgi:hypothetical protein
MKPGQPKNKFNPRAKPGRVIVYSLADKGLRRRMNGVMKEISKAPDSFEAIITYGAAPLKKLGQTTNRMFSLQTRFNAQVSAATASIRALEAPADVAAQVRLTLDTLQKSGAEIDALLKEAAKLARTRRDATREINIFLGAAQEVSRRYADEYPAKALKKFQATKNPKDAQCVQDIKKRAEDFQDRAITLEGFRAAAVIAKYQMKELTGIMKDTRARFGDIAATGEKALKSKPGAGKTPPGPGKS